MVDQGKNFTTGLSVTSYTCSRPPLCSFSIFRLLNSPARPAEIFKSYVEFSLSRMAEIRTWEIVQTTHRELRSVPPRPGRSKKNAPPPQVQQNQPTTTTRSNDILDSPRQRRPFFVVLLSSVACCVLIVQLTINKKK